MKSITVPSGTKKIAHAVKITREDGTIVAYTSHDVEDLVGGTTYLASPGVTVSSIVTESGFAVGNGRITFAKDDVFDQRGMRGGIWKNAAFVAFRYNFETLAVIEYLFVGTVGEVEIMRSERALELRDLRQAFNVPVGRVRQILCDHRLGSTDRCRVRLDPPAWQATTAYTVRSAKDAATGSVVKPTTLNNRHFKCTTAGTSGGSEPTWNTSIDGTTNDGTVVWTTIQALTVESTLSSFTSNQVFRDSSRGEAADFFAEGYITITDSASDNNGVSRKIRDYAADGTFTLWEPFPYDVDGTEDYTAVSGCRHRLQEDCKTKFDNQYNHGGAPHAPTQDEIAAVPDINV